ncbi:GMC oxidoreductase [Paenarthrobacter nicotinovorans]|uniref:GMC oxidoreductase n=1 Tax=Micrococcaceae TaxID=1268 RepID=UPI00286B50E5|nr:GMC oxidoreductase [Paenarthrobacter nicotinovorans]
MTHHRTSSTLPGCCSGQVSPTGQVWDVSGLFVAGNGVIPTPTACNPTLTGVALAVAGARHIAESINSTSTEK